MGVLLQTPGLTGCIVGARSARQGALIANLGVEVTTEQADAVWEIVGRLQQGSGDDVGAGPRRYAEPGPVPTRTPLPPGSTGR